MAGKKNDDEKPPVVRGFLHYFPRAIKAVALASKFGLVKYDLQYEDRNFMNLDPARLLDADGRHLLDEVIDGPYDPETGLLHAVHHAWEAMARLEVMLDGGVAVRKEESVAPPVSLDEFHRQWSGELPIQLPRHSALDELAAAAAGDALSAYIPEASRHLPPPAEKGVGAAPPTLTGIDFSQMGPDDDDDAATYEVAP
jgi:hypothetical protein